MIPDTGKDAREKPFAEALIASLEEAVAHKRGEVALSARAVG